MSDIHDDTYGTENDDTRVDAPAPERTFAAMPPAHGRAFAQSWWGQAWLKALEETALDNAQLKAGRKLARAGAVGAVSVRPGRITAVVKDSDGTPHRSDVLLQELSPEEWDRFAEMAIERAGHIAALLDRDMPPHLVEDSSAAGIDLLPGIGDLEPECDCEAWDHCGHTSALCYQVARLLDQDPFVLLLMRGRGERELLDELQVRSVARSDAPQRSEAPQGAVLEGVSATQAYAEGDILPPLPAPPELPSGPGLPPTLDTEAEPGAGLDVAAVEFLATRAAAEAYRLLAEALAPGHEEHAVQAELPADEDAVRLAAAEPETEVKNRLAAVSGRGREGLALAVRAWRFGGRAGLHILEEEWSPEAEALARARTALDAAWDEGERPPLRASHNHWTVVGSNVQLRLGRDGRWWPYRKERGQWTPAGPAAHDPATVLAVASGSE